MWAQGLTIGVLIAAGALTHARRQQALDEYGRRHLVRIPEPFPWHHCADDMQEPDHSWRDIVEQTSEENSGEQRT